MNNRMIRRRGGGLLPCSSTTTFPLALDSRSTHVNTFRTVFSRAVASSTTANLGLILFRTLYRTLTGALILLRGICWMWIDLGRVPAGKQG
jgi:hypothetical protein